jgi:hypothetical protein
MSPQLLKFIKSASAVRFPMQSTNWNGGEPYLEEEKIQGIVPEVKN